MTAPVPAVFFRTFQHPVQKPPDSFGLSVVLFGRKLLQLSEQRAKRNQLGGGGWKYVPTSSFLLQSLPFVETTPK